MPLAVALGDPAGIGPEIVAKSWERREALAVPPFFAVGDCDAIEAVWKGPLRVIAEPGEAGLCFGEALPVIRVGGGHGVTPGAPDTEGARNSLDALELAVGLTRSGAASGLVTGPVSKSRLYAIGFVHPGQTEFVAERCGVSIDHVAMMLVGPTLRTVPVTVHIPLSDVPAALTADRIVARGRATVRGLQQRAGQAARPRTHFIDALAVEWPRHPRDAAEQLAVEQEILAERLGCAETVTGDHLPQRRKMTGLHPAHAKATRSAHCAAILNAAIIAPGWAWPVPAMAKAVPWSGEVRTIGSPSVMLTPSSKWSVFSGTRAWSW